MNVDTMNVNRIAVIGAGVSGLVAVKTCIEEGLQPVCFEKDNQIGGLWVYKEEIGPDPTGPAGIYEGLITNVSKEMMAFSDFPFPRNCPPFLKSEDVLQYLQNYSEKFDLSRHIQFNTTVIEVTKGPDFQETGKWSVCTQFKDEQPKTEIFDAVMMCGGVQSSGSIPKYPGLNEFKGQIRHSGQFRGGKEFKNKTIVVVGSSHSAGEVAVLSCDHAKKVYISLRDGAWIVPRMMEKQPIGAYLNRRWKGAVPPWISKPLLKRKVESLQDWKTLGLQSSKHPINSSIMVNDVLPMKIMSGQVLVRSGLRRFEGSRVIFDDDSYLDGVDCVVFATGYNPGFLRTRLKDGVILGSSSQLELYLHIIPPRLEHPTMAAIGYIMTLGTLASSAELQSRYAVKVFKREVELPSRPEMVADIKKRRDAVIQQYGVDKPRINSTRYNDEVARAIGVLPSFWRLLLSDPKLAYHFYFGPAFPACYRLVGPHSSHTYARERILRGWDDLMHGIALKTVRPRALKRLEDLKRNRTTLITLVAVCFIGFILAVLF